MGIGEIAGRGAPTAKSQGSMPTKTATVKTVKKPSKKILKENPKKGTGQVADQPLASPRISSSSRPKE